VSGAESRLETTGIVVLVRFKAAQRRVCEYPAAARAVVWLREMTTAGRDPQKCRESKIVRKDMKKKEKIALMNR